VHRWLQIGARDPLSEAYAHDFNYYLPDDLLKKVDMASMAVGLESRAPFLDHRLVELSMRIPPQLKLKQNETKYLLKKSLVGILPESILRREKQGFGAPIGEWVRTELKEFIHDALSPGCKIESLFFREGIREVMDRVYVDDVRDDWRAAPQLWSLLMLELWMKEYV
jgi:asparagine synthase (glutamine-hydrolysing)